MKSLLDPQHQNSTTAQISLSSGGTGIPVLNYHPSTVLIPQSLLQYQPRTLQSTHTRFKVSELYTESQPSTSSYNENQTRQDREENWDVVRHKEYSRYHGNTKPRHFASHYKKEWAGRRDYTDPFGFSNLPRKWEYTETGLRYERDYSPRSKSKSGLPFTVMSYNILAQQLLEWHPHLYYSCSPESLDWQMRSEKILSELKYFRPDVICLQEVQFDHYESVFRKSLMKMGYGCEYLKRSGDKPDGCATFYNLDKFSLIHATPVEYQKGGLLDRDNVALILELAPNSKLYHGSIKKICVANTHLLYNPRRGDIKLAQLMVLLAELDKLLYQPSKNPVEFHRSEKVSATKYSPLVLCGDFNSEPYSAIYKFLTYGHFRYEGQLAQELSGQPEGYYGRNMQLKKHFFATNFGITDQCQYIKHVLKRYEHEMKKTGNVLESDETTEGSEIENPGSSCAQASNSVENCVTEIAKQNSVCSSFKNSSSTVTAGENWDAEINDNIPQGEASVNNVIQTSGSDKNVTDISDTRFPHFSQSSGKLYHEFNLVSAYKHRIQRFGFRQYEVTTQHDSQGCSVDYIFYSGSPGRSQQGQPASKEGKLKLLARYGLMSNEEIYHMGGLPNKVQPSDHVSLLTKFVLK